MSARTAAMCRQPMPQSREFSRITTDDVASSDRFDYWRKLFVGSYIDRPRSELRRAFHGEILGCAGGDGTVFANLRADPLICNFGKRDSDLILLGCVSRGKLRLRHGDDITVLDNRSGLILFDCDRPAVMSSTAYDISYLALPRAVVAAAMGGGDPIPPGMAMCPLPKDGLTSILLAHLRALAEHGAALDRFESTAATKAATSLALALLARLGRKPPEEDRARLEDALFAAARRYIELNCWRYDLTADKIAVAIGCSRAHLYRLFGSRGQTVASCLRDVRLQRARGLLETELSEPIGLIAFNTGYTDLSAFGKAFKRRFGMSPSDCRATALASGSSGMEPNTGAHAS